MKAVTILVSTVLLYGVRCAVLDPARVDIGGNQDDFQEDILFSSIQQKDLYAGPYDDPDEGEGPEETRGYQPGSYPYRYRPQNLPPKAIEYQQQAAELAKNENSQYRKYPPTSNTQQQYPQKPYTQPETHQSHEQQTQQSPESPKSPTSHSYTPTLDTSHTYSSVHVKSIKSPLDNALYALPANFSQEADLESAGRPKTAGSWIVRVQYGGVTVPARSSGSAVFVPEFPKPCDKCYITAMQGDIRFKDGTRAYLANGISLKQMTLYNTNELDLICPGTIYPIPSRIYSTGDEREVVRINPDNKMWGIEVLPDYRFSMMYHVENSKSTDETVFLTMTYEVIDIDEVKKQGYNKAAMVWLDVMGCNDVALPSNNISQFVVESPRWASSLTGRLLFASGHISDGGSGLTLLRNGDPICSSSTLYGRRAGYVDNISKKRYLSDISVCRDFGEVRVGDELSLVANYDTAAYGVTTDLHGDFRQMRGSARLYIGLS